MRRFHMSQKESDRYKVIQDVKAKKISQKHAAHLLGISTRQLRTLQRRIEIEGAEGLVSKKVGKSSNRKYPQEYAEIILERAVGIFKGWGPTLISEKLRETEGLSVSSEYVRKLLITHNIWNNRTRKVCQHLPRERRTCFGELIQGDSSWHHWFGEENPRCALIVMIDDATSTLTALYFAPTETTEAYFCTMKIHIEQWGIPRIFYSDRHSIFGGTCKNNNKSQFQRALHELKIQSIHAHTPQAKGRVERVNKTLQDRLVKELAYRGITTIEEGNKFLQSYILEHNARFSTPPKSQYDAHRIADTYDLDWILAHREERKIDRQLIFQYNSESYVLEGISTPRRYVGKTVSIRDLEDNKRSDQRIEVRVDGISVKVRKLAHMSPEPNYKIINLKEPCHWKPKTTHPYKKTQYMQRVKNDVLKTNWWYNK